MVNYDEDKALAQKVKAAVDALNEAAEEAARAGLDVSLYLRDINTLGQGNRELVEVDVSRPI